MATLTFTLTLGDTDVTRIWDAVRRTWDTNMSDKEASVRLADEVTLWFSTIVSRTEKAAAISAAESLVPQIGIVTEATADKPIDDTKVVVFSG